MKIKANKTKLRAAIEARLTEKQNQHNKDLKDWETKKKQRDEALVDHLSSMISQIQHGTYSYEEQQPFWNWPNSFVTGLPRISHGHLQQKPSENFREEKRLLAQLDIIEEDSIEIDDHSEYFRYI